VWDYTNQRSYGKGSCQNLPDAPLKDDPSFRVLGARAVPNLGLTVTRIDLHKILTG
jgi:hypothetical protein